MPKKNVRLFPRSHRSSTCTPGGIYFKAAGLVQLSELIGITGR